MYAAVFLGGAGNAVKYVDFVKEHRPEDIRSVVLSLSWKVFLRLLVSLTVLLCMVGIYIVSCWKQLHQSVCKIL